MAKKKSSKQTKNKVKNSVFKKQFCNKITEEKKSEDTILNNLNELNKKTLQPEELIKQITVAISKQAEEKERKAKLEDRYNVQSDNCKTIIYLTCGLCILFFVGLNSLLLYYIACTIIDQCTLGEKFIFDLLLELVNLINLFLSILFFVKTISYLRLFNIHKDIVNDNFTNDIPLISKITSFIKSITCKSKSSNDNNFKKTIIDVEEDNEKARKESNHNSILMIKLIISVYGIFASIAIIFYGIVPETFTFLVKLVFFLFLTIILWLLELLTSGAEEWSSASAYNFIAFLVSVISFILAILSILQTATPKT